MSRKLCSIFIKLCGIFSILLWTQPANADMLDKVVKAGLIQSGYDKKLQKFGDDIYDSLVKEEYQPYFGYTVMFGDIMVNKRLQFKWEF